MTAPTTDWLGTKVLRGFTEKYGTVGLYGRPGLPTTHSAGPVDLDAATRLLDVQFLEGDVTTNVLTPDGVRTIHDATRKTIVHPVTSQVIGVFKKSFQVHPFGPWLLDNAQQIAGSGLELAAVGLLSGDAMAFAQWEMPETVQSREGVGFRPYLTCGTAVNGTMSSTYMVGSTLIACSNIFQGSGRTGVKIRHSSKSLGRVGELQDKLGLLVSGDATAELESTVDALVRTDVSDAQWQAFLDAHPLTSTVGKDGQPKAARGLTNADEVRAQFDQLWNHDQRAATWRGTAWGVLMVDNTWRHWLQGTKGDTDRFERNAERAVKSLVAKEDDATLALLDRVLQTA